LAIIILLPVTTIGQGGKQSKARAINAAAVFLQVDKSTYSGTSTLRAAVMLDPAGQKINAAGLDLDFDPEALKVDKVAYATSVCEFIIPENRDNQAGVLNAACGSPDIQATTTMKMLDLTFTKQKSGWTDLDLHGSKLLAADGLGTDLKALPEYHRLYLEK